MENEIGPKKRGIGKIVLIVDDNSTTRKMLAGAFFSNGFKTCVEAENDKEGIKAAQRITPDVIILDTLDASHERLAGGLQIARIPSKNSDNSVHFVCRKRVECASFSGGHKPGALENRAPSHTDRQSTGINGRFNADKWLSVVTLQRYPQSELW